MTEPGARGRSARKKPRVRHLGEPELTHLEHADLIVDPSGS